MTQNASTIPNQHDLKFILASTFSCYVLIAQQTPRFRNASVPNRM